MGSKLLISEFVRVDAAIIQEWYSILARTLTYGGGSSLLGSTPSRIANAGVSRLIALICSFVHLRSVLALRRDSDLSFAPAQCPEDAVGSLRTVSAAGTDLCLQSTYLPRALLIVRLPVSTRSKSMLSHLLVFLTDVAELSPEIFLSSLGKQNQSSSSTAKTARMMGCKTPTPFAWTSEPIANGKTAAPPPPKAAAKAIADTCRYAGRTLVAATTMAGKSGPRKNPWSATKMADMWNDGTVQKRTWQTIAKTMYNCNRVSNCSSLHQAGLTSTANFSPSLGVTKPRTNLPTVIPVQKPVATMPDSKSLPPRSRRMKVTIQPPRATSAPT